MPLRCMNSTSGSTIQAFDLSDEEWAQLVITNKTQRHLRTICCAEELVLKQSKLGTQFFAHRRSSECNASVESEQHLRLKALAVEVLRAQGWDAITEAAGDSWRADVLGIRGNARAAIEIQWSPQDDEETLRRQRRYADNGIRCLWLFRQKSFPRSRELPAARVLEDKEKGFFTIVDTGS